MPQNNCTHSWCTPGATSRIAYTAEHWLGLTEGLLSCQLCNATALARLLAWRGENLDHRIFSIAGIETESATVFLRNMASDYCDLARKKAEWQALIATARPKRIGMFQLPELLCLDIRPLADLPNHPDWRQLSDEDASQRTWWAQFDV